MSSLARREDLAGKVQMIYMDPPYGIKFGSNFQPLIGKREVKDKETDLTREPEMVREGDRGDRKIEVVGAFPGGDMGASV